MKQKHDELTGSYRPQADVQVAENRVNKRTALSLRQMAGVGLRECPTQRSSSAPEVLDQ
jgi:hypothetical protein